MSHYTPNALAMLTAFFTTDTIEQTARRTGFVKRRSKISGKVFLALVTFGLWSNAKTTLLQLATKVTQLGTKQQVSAEAIHQRMNNRAVAFLQDLLGQALSTLQALHPVCEDGLFDFFTHVYFADSTGFGLPERLKTLFPGSGGSASPAGAKIQLVWEYKRSLFAHFALTAGNLPDQKYVDQVVALAQKGSLFLFDLGYFKIKAFACISQAGAYFLSRLNHQANLYEGKRSGCQNITLAITYSAGVPYRHGNSGCLTTRYLGTDTPRSTGLYSDFGRPSSLYWGAGIASVHLGIDATGVAGAEPRLAGAAQPNLTQFLTPAVKRPAAVSTSKSPAE
jgi:Transposase DDE domain